MKEEMIEKKKEEEPKEFVLFSFWAIGSRVKERALYEFVEKKDKFLVGEWVHFSRFARFELHRFFFLSRLLFSSAHSVSQN